MGCKHLRRWPGRQCAQAALGTIASIVDGGTKGDSSITIKVEEGSRGGDSPSAITFKLPRLADLALGGADRTDDKDDNDAKYVVLYASSRVVSGAFHDGRLTGTSDTSPYAVVLSARDSLTLGMNKGSTHMIAIDGDAAFKSIKKPNKAGYTTLGVVTITTVEGIASVGDDQSTVGWIDTNPQQDSTTTGVGGQGDDDPDNDQEQLVFKPATATDAGTYLLFDLDGDPIDEGLRGVLSIKATGTRGLFNDGDKMFLDYDKNGEPGSGESIDISADSDTGVSGSFSVDPDKSDSFTEAGVGQFTVYYMPGGKESINHGAKINLTAMVDYSDPSARDEKDATNSSTLDFDGVGAALKAYAIPHSTNGTGDKGNVRVRCEQPSPGTTDCRVFVECWDDMGMRGFGEAPMVAGNNLTKWDSAAIESVTGLEPSSRLSCRVLSRGMVTVQQLTRDGNSGTLVNNTYVGGGE